MQLKEIACLCAWLTRACVSYNHQQVPTTMPLWVWFVVCKDNLQCWSDKWAQFLNMHNIEPILLWLTEWHMSKWTICLKVADGSCEHSSISNFIIADGETDGPWIGILASACFFSVSSSASLSASLWTYSDFPIPGRLEHTTPKSKLVKT